MINIHINELELEDYILHTYRGGEFHVPTDTGCLAVINDGYATAVYPRGSWRHVHQPDSEAPGTTEDTTETTLEDDSPITREDIKRVAGKINNITTSEREH